MRSPQTEIKTLLKACQRSARDYALFLFLLDTGVRASELVAITVGDLNQERSSVLLRHTNARQAAHLLPLAQDPQGPAQVLGNAK